MQKILVATDFSERSDRALRRATLLGKQTGAKLWLVHAIDDDQPRRIIESEHAAAVKLLSEQSATLRDVDGVDCSYQVILGEPSNGIAQATQDISPDLLVVGPHRRQVLRDIFVGTTAERTIRAATLPVLMANASAAGPYRNVLFATELSEPSGKALAALLSLGLPIAGRLSILHVFDAPALRLAFGGSMGSEGQQEYLREAETEAASALARFLRDFDVGSAAKLTRHDETSPANAILDQAREMSADLIAVGTRGRSALSRALIGSVAEAVLRASPVDVIAIPPNRD
jgi:nucleotide-binding universal stress UspA family protein